MTKSYYLELEGMICLHQRHIFILNVEKKYVQDPQYWRSQGTEAKLHQEEKEAAHETADMDSR